MDIRRFVDSPLRRLARVFAILAVLAGSLAGCGEVRDFLTPAPPDVAGEWKGLLDEARAFERRIGFRDTANFRRFSGEHESFPFCGYVSRFYLPYSYEDAHIRWIESASEAECAGAGDEADTYFGAVEAWGESASPVTPSMIESKLDRFLYLVIHEDCHDQFDLPFGIEEALCNVIAYHAMAAFTAEKFGRFARANRAVRRYVDVEVAHTRATVTYYDQLAALYARYERAEISSDALLEARAAIFMEAERALDREQGDLNNLTLANEMTYSRHYPYLESVFKALGQDLARTVAFFRHVDRTKPSRAAIMKRHRIAAEESVESIRAHEASVVETIARALAESRTAGGAQGVAYRDAR